LEKPLQKLGNFLLYAMQPDQRLPFVGDDDGGRLLALDGLSGDIPIGILDTLAAVFNSEELSYLSSKLPEEALWLIGPTAVDKCHRHENRESKQPSAIFPDTGYAFLRSGWKKDDAYISFDCGPHGWLNYGHAHADMLSVQIYAKGKVIIRDPGTYSYQEPWRFWFRSAKNHAVILLDGNHPAIPATPFHWRNVPFFRKLKHQLEKRIDYVAGTMDAGTWQHSREIFFFKPDLIVLLDTIEAEGIHEIEARFPLASTEWEIIDNTCISTEQEKICSIQWNAGMEHKTELIEGWQSECYGQRKAASILTFRVTSKTPYTVATLVSFSNMEHQLRRERRDGQEVFLIEARHQKQTIAIVQCSYKEKSVCAAFVE
jgi:hypothetical protein